MEGFLGIGGTEFVIILIFAFLIFGPDKLPEIARTIGRAIARFRDAQNEVNEVIRKEVYDPNADGNPLEKAAQKAEVINQSIAGTETFAERKARYDKIRAERKAKEDAARAEAAKKAGLDKSDEATTDATAATTSASDEVEEIDIDALMGVKKPAPKTTNPQVPTASEATPAGPAPAGSASEGSTPEGGDA